MKRYTFSNLKQGLVGAWCPSVSGRGLVLPDLSGYNNHGVLTNMDPGTDWVTSGGKGALDFDGVNDHVSTSSFAISREITTSVSISVWMTLLAVGRQSTMFGCESGSRMQTHCPWSDGNIYWDFGGAVAPNRLIVGGQSFALNAWNHMVFIAGAIGSQVWRNGLLIGSSPTGISRTAGNDFFSIGKTGADHHSGQIDDIRIYNRALTPTEIQQLYTGGRGVGLAPERIKHRRKTTAAAFNRRRRILIGASS